MPNTKPWIRVNNHIQMHLRNTKNLDHLGQQRTIIPNNPTRFMIVPMQFRLGGKIHGGFSPSGFSLSASSRSTSKTSKALACYVGAKDVRRRRRSRRDRRDRRVGEWTKEGAKDRARLRWKEHAMRCRCHRDVLIFI